MSTRYFTALVICLLCSINIFANDYEEAWKALHQNNRKSALEHLQKAMNDPSTTADAYITYIYLSSFEGKEGDIKDFASQVYEKLADPNPYVYAMWFKKGVLGDYGKKTPTQQLLLDKILSDGKCNGSLQAAAHYVESWSYVASNDFPHALAEAGAINAAGPLWQLVGPFDNLSGSGFNKEYGPLQHPEPDAVFKSVNNADIGWFTPLAMNKDGWTFPYAHIRYSSAVIFAQVFVNAAEDMKVLLNAGCNGALKVWVNDEPVLAEQKELVTELDYYKNFVQLKKGCNRLLVQLSYTNNSMPNFIVRFTDDHFMPVKGLSYTPAFQKYPAAYSAKQASPSIKHFAETFFENKLKEQPDNIINYVLLCETYLRNQKTAEARTLIEDVLKRFPDNSLLRLELMSCYLKENNNTLLLQETERMKEKDPDCLLAARLNIQQLMQSEKYQEADEEIKKYDAQFKDEDNEILNTKVRLYGTQNKMDELINLIENTYKEHPDDPNTVILMFNVKMKVNKDVKAALNVYENYLKNNFNADVVKNLVEEYKNQGMAEKELELQKDIAERFPYDPDALTDIANYYFDRQDYSKASQIGQQVLLLAPYVSTYWENLGVELQQQHNDEKAADAFKKAIYYNANSYSAREQLRTIQKKPSVWKAFPQTDVYELIHKSASDTIKDFNYYYLLDEKFAVIYPEGACEEYFTYAVKILNDKGIDDWKETNISYNSNSSYLIIEKAETVKKNGVKTPAEQNDNQIVFTGLEAGDAIVLKYKIQHYDRGRLAKEYWNKFMFNAFVPEKSSRFCLLAANNVKMYHKALNAALQPAITPYDDFTLYSWQMENSPALKSESYMPPSGDVCASVTVSTIDVWSHISGWYSDLSAEKTEEDFELKKVFNQLFPKGTGGMLQKNIAGTIYTYICKNIRYSSVSFRQGAFVPQKPSVTINTGLGDCKDLSTLFVALSKLAGIKANLVLVDTRDNGQKTMPLPSVEFNHCIVRTELDGKPYFLELTDNTLPFGSLPSNLYKAACLVIPSTSKDTAGGQLEYIDAVNRTADRILRKSEVTIDNNDITEKINVTKTGVLSASLRYKYASLSREAQREQMEKNISGSYKNPVTITALSFKGLDHLDDSLNYSCSYTVKDEISELGDIKMMKIPFEDLVATLNNFSLNERHFPVEYWRYEEADEYETTVDITAPEGMNFIELPKDASFNFLGSTYRLHYIKKDNNHLTIERKASLRKENVSPKDYVAMKEFLNNIIKAEAKYIAFKAK